MEILCRVFRVHSRLDGTSFAANGEFLKREIFARGLLNHPFNKVDPSHFLGDAMFDLQTCVDFKEVEVAARVIVDKLHRSHRLVFHRFAQSDCRADELFPDGAPKTRCRRLLDNLLVSPLHGAIALSKCSHRAAAVPENLHLNVSSLRDEFFQVYSAASKIRLAQPRDRLKRLA